MPIIARKVLPIVGVVVLFGTGCTVGSGDRITETRAASEFHEVVLQTSGNVNIAVTGTESVSIEADDNILELLTTEVIDGRLVLGSSGPFSTTSPITYTITATELSMVSLGGSGNITVSAVGSNTFQAYVSGSGNIEPSGKCTSLAVTISGSGNFQGENLTCVTGIVEISGSGNVTVNTEENLEANISGSGSIVYLGEPTVTSSVSGSGEISGR